MLLRRYHDSTKAAETEKVKAKETKKKAEPKKGKAKETKKKAEPKKGKADGSIDTNKK